MPSKSAQIVFIVIACLASSGCASFFNNPYVAASYARVPSAPLVDDYDKIFLSLLGGQLLEQSDRQELHRIANKLPKKRSMTASESAVSAGALGDAIAGDVRSELGLKLSAGYTAVSIVADLLSDTSHIQTSGALIPKYFNGAVIESPNQAKDAFLSFLHDTISDTLTEKGFTPKCLEGCNTDSMVMGVDISTMPSDLYVWSPTSLLLVVSVGDFSEVSPGDPISKLAGFDVAYRTNPGNSVSIVSFVGPAPFADRETKYGLNDEGRVWMQNVKPGNAVHFGRDILKAIHSTPFTFAASKVPKTKYLIYNGEIYSFSSDSKPIFVDLLLKEPNQLSYLSNKH